mgnify:CR=1 FL=1
MSAALGWRVFALQAGADRQAQTRGDFGPFGQTTPRDSTCVRCGEFSRGIWQGLGSGTGACEGDQHQGAIASSLAGGDGDDAGGDGVAVGRVHHHHAGGGGRFHVDIIDADAGAPDHLQIRGGGEDLFRHLGVGTDRKAVIVLDDRQQFLGLEAGFDVDIDAAIFEDFDGLLNTDFCFKSYWEI